MQIREYRAEDFSQLWRLDQECFTPGIAYSRFELMHYIRRPGAFTLVAENRDAIVGFLVAECRTARGRSQRRQTGHIITIDVSAATRRSGLGTSLMDAAERRLKESGCDVVYLETAVDNAAAISFYRRRGYSVLSVIPRYYEGKLDALLMGKKLATVQ